MVLKEVVDRFLQHSPVTVMARVALQRALDPEWIDALFERERKSQYTRELLFSTVVDVMASVAVGLHASVHVAARMSESLDVSITALYDKINRTEPDLVRALVKQSAAQLSAVVQSIKARASQAAPGYRVRILDGNHLPATDKRLKVLRGFRGAALPGQSLVVYDPDLDMIVDLIAEEDAHAQERALMSPVLQSAEPGDLWIADRNFSTRTILCGWHRRGSYFIVREHGSNPNPAVLGAAQEVRRLDNGVVYEQAVCIDEDGLQLPLRRIEIRLDHPTEDGDTVIRILTNAPAAEFGATEIANLYRRRWTIETMFQRLESVLKSEVRTLGQPRAALLAFGVAALALNVLSVIAQAVKVAHKLDASEVELSAYYIALAIKTHYQGMMIAVPQPHWVQYDDMSREQLADQLLTFATFVKPKTFRTNKRGPKRTIKPGSVSAKEASRHVSTARVIKNGGIK
ncbi:MULTISPECIES: IS4 family transposase [unclassified Caballeronia]|uniref:IS4 family transposase n=1 Tax=unclassified Caballeronia TaxID=2646786 RepID=UPI0020284DD7|nr:MULTISPECIES: IS4 family transposase [unclassified Caballeronia]